MLNREQIHTFLNSLSTVLVHYICVLFFFMKLKNNQLSFIQRILYKCNTRRRIPFKNGFFPLQFPTRKHEQKPIKLKHIETICIVNFMIKFNLIVLHISDTQIKKQQPNLGFCICVLQIKHMEGLRLHKFTHLLKLYGVTYFEP